MKLVNKTNYPTRELRKVMIAVHNEEAQHRGRLKAWRWLQVTISYSRRGNQDHSGHAYYGASPPRMHLSLPHGGLDATQLAALFKHELWHSYGIHHEDYPPSVMWCKPEPMAWIIETCGWKRLADPEPTKQLKPSADEKRTKKTARLLDRRKAWVTKLRRAETALKKIDKSLRYHEKQGAPVPELAPAKKAARPKRRRRKKR